MRVAITGASGYVGTELVAVLEKGVEELLLVSRDPEKLARAYPGHKCIGYDKLQEAAAGFDMLLCLLTMNNNLIGSIEDFREVNVNKVVDLAEVAGEIGISIFVHFSTFQIIGANTARNHYALSKLEAETALEELHTIRVVNLRLPIIYGSSFNGKLDFILRLPKWSRRAMVGWLSALKPAVHIDLVAKEVLEMPTNKISGRHYVSNNSADNIWYKVSKRMIDVFAALLIVVFLGGFFPLIWLIVKITSSGPAVFSQRRVGRNKREFNCYKFRTMYLDTAQCPTHEISSDSVTPIGKFLRATKIDELPQVVNIFKNEMSLIGPRPCLPQQTELIKERDLLGVFDVKPGITGLAQIKGIDMSGPAVLAQVDSDYIHVQSLWLDLRILIATVFGQGFGDRVAKN